MKLSKNILILIGSYLGMLVLVCCTAQFLIPLTTESSGGDVLVNAGGTDDTAASVTEAPEDVPAGAAPSESGDTDSSAGGTETASGDRLEDPSGDAGADEPTYYLRSVKEEGSASAAVIGVYDEDGNLIRVLETPVLALPLSDRALLDVGIEVEGEEDLGELIEDFGG